MKGPTSEWIPITTLKPAGGCVRTGHPFGCPLCINPFEMGETGLLEEANVFCSDWATVLGYPPQTQGHSPMQTRGT